MSVCHSCNGLIGRDCWNPQECAEITERMAMDAERHPATDKANTAGLVAEIDAEMQGRRRGYADVRGELLFRCRDSLVTAASAQARIAALEAERDDADRRAGAAERLLEGKTDRIIKRERWLRDAKEARGYHQNISFDRVWADTCAAADRAQAAEARADRLATLVKRLSEDLSAALERAYEADAEWVKAKYPNGASPIRLLAALQDQPK